MTAPSLAAAIREAEEALRNVERRAEEAETGRDEYAMQRVAVWEQKYAALRSENERLREALRAAAKYAENCNPESGVVHFGVDSGVAEWQRDMVVVRAVLAEVGK